MNLNRAFKLKINTFFVNRFFNGNDYIENLLVIIVTYWNAKKYVFIRCACPHITIPWTDASYVFGLGEKTFKKTYQNSQNRQIRLHSSETPNFFLQLIFVIACSILPISNLYCRRYCVLKLLEYETVGSH